MKPNFEINGVTYEVFKFPSGEVQVRVTGFFTPYSNLTIKGSILSNDHIMELFQLVSILNRLGIKASDMKLIMPYCAYSRQDRVCNPGEALSMQVFAKMINSLGFGSIETYDNHSDVATAVLDNCTNVPVEYLLNPLMRKSKYDYFISPDAGANKKVLKCSQKFHVPMLRADKVRDTRTGEIKETKIYADKRQLKGNKTVLIIDDICAGGRTFKELTKAIKDISPECEVHLFVTHGFFNNSVEVIDSLIESGISKILTTNSVYNLDHKGVACTK